jgi:glycosyltransferase involved in cell wall biosynthesis
MWCRTMREDHGVSALRVDNGVDLQRFQPAAQAADDEVAVRLGLRPGAPLWLAVGGVEERKNTLRSLQAFAMHRRWHAQAQLVIAGGASLLDHGAYQATFHEALVDSGLGDDAVRLIGTVADADMPALYRLADGLLMPSLREGFGLVVLEALASATPVVVSRLAPFTEFLANADACWADPLVAADIAAAMGRALRITITEVPEVCRRFDWRLSALRHAEIYAGLREGATLAGV